MRIARVKNATLPNGPATLVFRKWETTKSKKRNPMFVLTHTPLTGEPIIDDYVAYETTLGYLKLEAFLSAMGIDLTDEDELDTDVLDHLLGCEFTAHIENEVFNGVTRPRIRYYGSLDDTDTSGGAQVPPTTPDKPSPLAPLLPKEEQEKRRQALLQPTNVVSEAEYRSEMQAELERANVAEAASNLLTRLNQQRAK